MSQWPGVADDYQLQRYHWVHARAIEYLGGRCVRCGSIERLEIDHIDRATKSFNISDATCLSWERILEELAKCQCLCHDCHKTKSDEEFRVPHGGGKYGRRGCSCDLCITQKRKGNREYARERRARLKTTSGATDSAL